MRIQVFKITILFFLVHLTSSAYAENPILTANTYSIDSKIMNENRQYYVYLPPSYYEDSEKSFPVVYVLDGDVHRLRAISGIIEALSTETLEKQIEESIVVAIPNSVNAIRERDFTPTDVNWTFKGRTLEKFDNIGNADTYLKFFNNELIPEVDNKYRSSNKRVLVGESFGGLFAAHAFLFHPNVFTDYLIIDATYLWDDNYLNRKYSANKINENTSGGHIFLSFANNEAFGEIGETNLKWGLQFHNNIQQSNQEGLFVHKKYFDSESHGTVALQSWYFGFKVLLEKK